MTKEGGNWISETRNITITGLRYTTLSIMNGEPWRYKWRTLVNFYFGPNTFNGRLNPTKVEVPMKIFQGARVRRPWTSFASDSLHSLRV